MDDWHYFTVAALGWAFIEVMALSWVDFAGIEVPGITLPSKSVTLKGFNGLKNGVTIESFDLPANDPAGGIQLTIQSEVTNVWLRHPAFTITVAHMHIRSLRKLVSNLVRLSSRHLQVAPRSLLLLPLEQSRCPPSRPHHFRSLAVSFRKPLRRDWPPFLLSSITLSMDWIVILRFRVRALAPVMFVCSLLCYVPLRLDIRSPGSMREFKRSP